MNLLAEVETKTNTLTVQYFYTVISAKDLRRLVHVEILERTVREMPKRGKKSE